MAATPFSNIETDLVYRSVTSPLCLVVLVGVLWALLFFQGMYFNSIGNFGSLACFLFSLMGLGFFVGFISWVWFWQKMIFDSIPWGLACVLCPGLVYRYAMIHWEESRRPMILHVCAIVFGVSAAKLLAIRIDATLFEAMGSFVNFMWI